MSGDPESVISVYIYIIHGHYLINVKVSPRFHTSDLRISTSRGGNFLKFHFEIKVYNINWFNLLQSRFHILIHLVCM